MNPCELELVLFRTFTGHRTACFAGRVMHRSGVAETKAAHGSKRRLREAWRLLISRRIKSAKITIRLQTNTWHTLTDRHGYFFMCRELESPIETDGLWVNYSCVAEHPNCKQPIEASSQLLNAPQSAQYFVISDIDDTVVQTGVANKLRMLWELFFAPSLDRQPLPGIIELLKSLHSGASHDAHNPMLYVSRSPWSIHPMLVEFFSQHKIPVGPVMLLRDWGISWRHPLPRRAEDHKMRMIESALLAYSNLPVVLIGDSGQLDPETYAEVVDRYPKRVKAVYIRDLSLSQERSEALNRIRETLIEQNVDFVFSKNAEDFIQHAQGASLI